MAFSSQREAIDQLRYPDTAISFDVYKRLIEELSHLRTKTILIDYLEPFTDPQLIEKIHYAKQHNLKCIVITNGSLINQENAEKLVDLKLDYLNISINAATPETYTKIHLTEKEETFEQIKSMLVLIEKIKEKNHSNLPQMRLSMVVCNRNYKEIKKLVELCHDIGVGDALIKKLYPWSKEVSQELQLTDLQEEETRKILSQALESAKKYDINLDVEQGMDDLQKTQNVPCYYGWLFSLIDADGNVYPCCLQNRSPECRMGNIKESSFKMIWQSKKYQNFRKNSKNIDERTKMGFLCNHPGCFFNNQHIYKMLHEPYLLPVTYTV